MKVAAPAGGPFLRQPAGSECDLIGFGRQSDVDLVHRAEVVDVAPRRGWRQSALLALDRIADLVAAAVAEDRKAAGGSDEGAVGGDRGVGSGCGEAAMFVGKVELSVVCSCGCSVSERNVVTPNRSLRMMFRGGKRQVCSRARREGRR